MMEKIESEDLLMEILQLLPPKSIFRFMCVSKRWRNIIMHPFFLQRYSAAAGRRCGGGRLLAFFQRTTISHHSKTLHRRRSDGGRSLSFCQRTTIFDHCNTLRIPFPESNIIKEIPKNLGYFINSSNGLILCSREDSSAIYHVLNPVTGKYISLPPPPNGYLPKSAGIMCEENTTDLVPIYTIIRAGLPLFDEDNNMYIDTYSSRTGEWSNPRQLIATGKFCLLSQPPVVANGVFHWYTTDRAVALYNPNSGEDNLQLIQLPLFGDRSYTYTVPYAISRSVDDDLLWFGETYGARMKFYMLPKGEDGSYRGKATINRENWILIYYIHLNSLYKDAEILTKEITLESIICLSNSQIVGVLRHVKEVFLCNLESKSIEMVEYYGRNCDDYLCPYIESCFLSSYALNLRDTPKPNVEAQTFGEQQPNTKIRPNRTRKQPMWLKDYVTVQGTKKPRNA